MATFGGVRLDYTPTLSIPERARPGLGDILGAAAQGAFGQVRYGLPYQARQLAGDLTPEDEAFYQQGLARAAAAASRAAPASVDDLLGGRVNPVRFAAENLTSSLPYMVGAAAGALGGAALGGGTTAGVGTVPGAIAGAVLGGVPQFSASNVARAVEEQGALDDAAAVRALAVAPVQSAADAAIGRFLPGAGKLLGPMAATQAGGLIARTGKAMLKAGATEAITEAAQQVGERYAAGIDVTGSDAAAEYVNAAVTAFAVGGVMGAGGGIRRTPALAKNPRDVTNEDLMQHQDLLALPAPSDFIVGPDGQTRVNPSGNVQLALPSPEMFQGPDVLVDSAGRAVPAENITDLRRAPRPSDSLALDPFLAEIPQAPLALPSPEMFGAQPGGPQLGSGPTVMVDAAERASPTLVDLLATPRQSQLSPEQQFQADLATMKKGLRGGFVQSVTATTPEELFDRVYDQVFTEQDTRANTAKFAQRLGILDENMEPGPAARQVEARRAAAAAVQPEAAVPVIANEPVAPTAPRPAQVEAGPDFEARWRELQPRRLGGATPEQRASEQQRLDDLKANSRNETDLRRNVWEALGTETKEGDTRASVVEQLARKLGLVTDDDAMDVTPLGRATQLETPSGTEDIVAAGVRQGYTGAQASGFERGARSFLGAPPVTSFGTFEDMAAYEAGRVWASQYVSTPQVATAAKSEATVDSSAPVRRVATDVDPVQVNQKALNNLIDNADLSKISDQDVTRLRRMVADGAAPIEVGRAIEKLQGGGTLRVSPPTRQFQPSAPTRGGQPRFREMKRDDTTRRAAGVDTVSKADQRTETEGAVKAYDYRNLIEMARAEGAMTDARAQKLHDLLDEGKIDQAARLLRDFDPDAQPRKRLPTPPERVDDTTRSLIGEASAKFEQAVDGKSFHEVLDYMIERAPSRFHRQIARSVQQLAKRLEKAGVEFTFKLAKPGDQVPVTLTRADNQGLTRASFNPPRAEVWMKSAEVDAVGGGTNYQKTLHEMLHAVTIQMVNGLRRGTVDKTSKIGKAVTELLELSEAVVGHTIERFESGKATDVERRLAKTNAITNPDELIAWGLTNPDVQRYLNEIEYAPKQSVWSKFVELIRRLLGLDVRQDGALNELLRVSEQLFDAPQAELTSMIERYNPNVSENATLEAQIMLGGAATRTAAAANEATRTAAETISAAVDRINPAQLLASARRKLLGGLSNNQLVRAYGELVPGVAAHQDALAERRAVRGRFAQIGDDALQRFEKLEREKPEHASWLGKLMALTTEFQVDPDKTWDEHTHIADAEKARIKPLYEQAVKFKNDLSRSDGAGGRLFNDLRMLNDAQNRAQMASELHRLVVMDPELSVAVRDAGVNPVDTFMRTRGLDSAGDVLNHWVDALNSQLGAVETYLRDRRGMLDQSTAKDREKLQQHMAPIDLKVRAVHEALARSATAPYFHLGRFGDHFVSFEVVKGDDGAVNAQARDTVAQELQDAGFTNAQISADNTKPRVMLRIDSKDARQQLVQLVQQLEKRGLVEKDTTKAGPRQQANNYGVADGVPAFVSKLIAEIETAPRYNPTERMNAQQRAALEERKAEEIQTVMDMWLESQPDSAISKVLTKRYTVPGYDPDMMRNWAHRWRVGGISLSNISAAPKINQAFLDMRGQYQDALTPWTETTATEMSDELARQGVPADQIAPRVALAQAQSDPDLVNDLMTELTLRDATTPVSDIADTFDKMRAVAHSYYLGLSPAYVALNLTQLGVTALPELAKGNGYAKAFHAMRRASGQAWAILKAAQKEAAALGPERWADVAITESVLAKAGLSDDVQDFALHMMASGSIDIGSAARSFSQIAEGRQGSRLDTALKYASALGTYSETFSRLTAALAARELKGGSGPEVEAYAKRVVSNAMFDFQSDNTARYLGKAGILGPVTPMVTQFMQYSIQLTEKLYSEFVDAVGKTRPGETAAQAAARRKSAQQFMVGHLAAVTSLAGTLGMPFASAFAAVLDRVIDGLDDDDDPTDVVAAYRGFLADTLGKDMAEVVSRGLPRAFGFDLSTRAGEQNLLPFSDFLADRRSWKDAVEAQVGKSIGAAPGMFVNVLDGGAQIADGDVLGGMKTMLPVALKNTAEAYRMTNEGYIDTKGNRLPLTPGASDILWQLLGFSPAEKAEYSEARGDQMVRRGEIGRKATQLRQRITRAMLDGDMDTARELVGEAQQFDADNPAFAVIPGLANAVQGQQQARARAAALQTPVGVSMRDIAGQQLTRYANVDYAR